MTGLNEWRRLAWGDAWHSYYASLPAMVALQKAHANYDLCMRRARMWQNKGVRGRTLVFGMVAGIHGREMADLRRYIGLTTPPPSPENGAGGRWGRPIG